MTFEDLKRLLFQRSNFGVKLGLERIRAALRLLDDPHRAYAVLHVAGTNGKGSTCAFAEAALRAARLRVGLYTSPHLRHFCERIRVAGEPLPEVEAARLLEEIVARIPWALSGGPAGPRDGDGLTFFELSTLLGFLAFARAGVQIAVVEVGLGGRLDATNVVEPIVCAVSALGLEHTQYLGPTLSDIAAEKGGIFKRGAAAVSAGQPAPAARVLERCAREASVGLWRPGRDYRFEGREGRPFCYAGPTGWVVRAEPVLEGRHQRSNAALACALLEAAARKGLDVQAEHAAAGLASARWPGRLERAAERPLVLLDGAHNPHAARALAATLPTLVGGRPLHLVFAAMADKDSAGMLRELIPLARSAHFCAADSPRAAAPDLLSAQARRLGFREGDAYPSVAEALRSACHEAGEQGAVLCCGSLYLVGEIQGLLEGRAGVPMPSERL